MALEGMILSGLGLVFGFGFWLVGFFSFLMYLLFKQI